MKDKEILILSTRQLDKALIEKAAFKNITIDIVSFIQIKKQLTQKVTTQIEALSQQQATIVFTSVNAVEIVVAALPKNYNFTNWNIYCIGGATFTLVKKYWPYESIAFTAKNAAGLANKIVLDKVQKIIFFCGNKRLDELPVVLKSQNIEVEELVVYETIETPLTIDRFYNGILFFSPSAVNSYFSNNQPKEETILFAIGNTTANAIKQFTSNRIIVSDFPAKDQLVDKAIKYFDEVP